MPKLKMIKSVISEYGITWAACRVFYSAKLWLLRKVPLTEKLYEENTSYPQRLELFTVDIKALQRFLHTMLSSEEKANLISIADRVCHGVIIGFSSIELNYGSPIDWQLNPLTGRRCDEKAKWYSIPDFDMDRGDIKVVWEVSRFSHFITLARAYLLTEDVKYYQTFSSQLKQWLDKNPYSYGANFKCGQECSLRMVNALLAFTVFRECGVASDADESCLKDLIDRCYRKILSNFYYAYRCIKNNHTISELMGMIIGAWCCNDSKQMNTAYDLLDEVIDKQFTDDGGYLQFSFNYQRLALQDLECVMSISNRTGRHISEISKDKVNGSAMLLYQCMAENGDMPNYGANDGALVFPVTSCSYRDFRSDINTIHALATGKQLFGEGTYQESLIWFSGDRKLQEYTFERIKKVSSRFLDAGLFTLRNKHSWVMIIANEYHSRPAHMDQLHFDLWIDNINVLCDTGTYSYASKDGKRLVGNSSHNTVLVDGCMQMNMHGHFMIYDWTKRKLGRCDNKRFVAECISTNGYVHRRKVEKNNSSFKIVDTVSRDCRVLFHTPCDISREGDAVILLWKGKELCRIKSSGKIEVSKSNRSLYYLKKEQIYCLSIAGRAGENIITVISEEEQNG